jgi:hypothetical protein
MRKIFMRRTPPIAKQVIPPFRPTKALLQARLIDFDTGGHNLEEQHKTWLEAAIKKAAQNSSFHVRIYGFASKLGGESVNKPLSLRRMNTVFAFVKGIEGRAMNSLEIWEAAGSSFSPGKASDNSPEWRAVEVHIFIGSMPPVEPPENKKVEPPKDNRPPLPGGTRHGKWAVAAPGGAVITVGPSIGVLTAGVSFGVNIFMIRNTDTKEVRRYWSPQAGLGASLGIPVPFKSVANVIQTLITGPNFSNLSFTDVFASHAATWEEVEACLVSVQGVNAGNGPRSSAAAVITFHSPGIQQYGPSGLPLKVAEDLWSFNSAGKNYQIGAGINAVAGPLHRI